LGEREELGADNRGCTDSEAIGDDDENRPIIASEGMGDWQD